MATPSSKKPIEDVAKPGKTAASATSRPVIVNHGAMVKDPMVNTEDPAAPDLPTQDGAPAAAPAPKKVVAPLEPAASDETKDAKPVEPEAAEEKPKQAAEEPEPAKAEAKPEKPADEKPAEKTDSPENTEESKPESTEENQSDDAIVDAVADQVADKKAQDKQAEEDQKRQETVDKLVAGKEYFVPLAVARHERNSKIGLITLAVVIPLLVAAGVALAIDAGLIGQNISLPFDVIK